MLKSVEKYTFDNLTAPTYFFYTPPPPIKKKNEGWRKEFTLLYFSEKRNINKISSVVKNTNNLKYAKLQIWNDELDRWCNTHLKYDLKGSVKEHLHLGSVECRGDLSF